MNFKYSCFIRKNTPELRKKLEQLGYEFLYDDDFKNQPSKYILTMAHGSYALKLAVNKEMWLIDCGTNDELFLAIAAMRDDSDYMQWFIDFKGRMFLCEYPYVMLCLEIPERKATLEELIEHFK